MATQRKIVFLNDEYYHVFNRGIDRRVTFTNKREYCRVLKLLYFYQFTSIPLRYSRFFQLPKDSQQEVKENMLKSGKLVDVVAYCLMPNHFHLLLRQRKENGISTYVSNFMNAYTKYFNTKHEREGSLFQGVFKAVYVETEEQLVHLTRYIHLNPVASSLIKPENLNTYDWSSYPAYLSQKEDTLVDAEAISLIYSLIPDYESFVRDQISYAKELEKIKQLIFESS